jgi:hypothetical protein
MYRNCFVEANEECATKWDFRARAVLCRSAAFRFSGWRGPRARHILPPRASAGEIWMSGAKFADPEDTSDFGIGDGQ